MERKRRLNQADFSIAMMIPQSARGDSRNFVRGLIP